MLTSVTLSIMLVKTIVIFGIMRLFQKPDGVSLRTAVSLSQVGEFGLVLITLRSLTNCCHTSSAKSC